MNKRLHQRRELEMQADRIEAIVQRHHISGRVQGGTVTHRQIQFYLSINDTTKARQVQALAEPIAAGLNVETVRVYRQGGRWLVEIPLEPSRLLRLPKLLREVGDVPPMTAVLGNHGDGQPLLLRITGNVLLIGDTGAGKTMLLRSMVAGLSVHNPAMQFVLVDPKRRGLGPLTAIRNTRLFDDAYDAYDMAGDMPGPVVVVVDEVADNSRGLPGLYDNPQLGIYTIAATRSMDAVDRRRFNVHIAGHAERSPYDGADKLQGRGDMMALTSDEMIRFQAAWLGAKELEQIANEVKR